tara:strand:- start:1 stop:249 length:249 start_codon:yes stop_codon:yes gene_type:complete
MSIQRKERLKFRNLFQNEDTITLRQVYQRAKIIFPYYSKESFANFISDFGNGGSEFFSSFKVYLDFMKRDEDWEKYYRKYYN